MRKFIYTIVLIAFFCNSIYSQVITQRGTSQWIEQQGKIHVNKNSTKYSVPPLAQV